MRKIDYYMSLPYRMEIVPDVAEGGFAIIFPDLPGCLTCADSIPELIESAEDAKRAWFAAALKDKRDIPEPSEIASLSAFSGQFKLRMPKSLHRSLAIHAKQEGISMNQYCNYLLSMNDAKHTAAQ